MPRPSYRAGGSDGNSAARAARPVRPLRRRSQDAVAVEKSSARKGRARSRIRSVVERCVHLYRVMAEVCAGPEQRNCAPGQTGLATVWVRSDSEQDARRQAQSIVESRKYHSVGELSVYLEHTHGSPSGGAGDEDPLAAGYTTMKEKALGSGDGLFEIWFPAK